MGNSPPEHESAHDHELVTDDDLLEEGSSSPVSGDVFEAARAARLEPVFPRPGLVRAGEVLAGKYRVERIYAPGVLGVTCDAEHLELRQRVVIKLCAGSGRNQSERAARFLQSARLAAQLRNAHLARVLDLGTLDSGVAYSVTEHLSGTDLRGVLRVREWLPVSEAVDYALQICEGLAVAHVAGLVHRNLKLANVFLARESEGHPIIKLLDFCPVDGSLIDASVTMSTAESVVSSLAYLAPEQVREPSSVDVRADIWAIGALLHELLTGFPLYAASSAPGIFAAIAADSVTPMSQLRGEIPAELEEIVLRCLEKERDYRWSDVGTLAKQLRRFASEEGRAAVERVVLVLERRARSTRSTLPPPMPKTDAAGPIVRPASSAPRVESPQRRRSLEFGLAALAILGCSMGVGAFVTIHNLQSILAARIAVARPVVASLSPALTAVPAAAPLAAAPLASVQSAVMPAPVQVTPPTAKLPVRSPTARPHVEPAAGALAPVASQQPVKPEPATSPQALFDNAN